MHAKQLRLYINIYSENNLKVFLNCPINKLELLKLVFTQENIKINDFNQFAPDCELKYATYCYFLNIKLLSNLYCAKV